MKVTIYILLFYLFTISALPTVRAIKMLKKGDCEMSCNKDKQMECDNAKFVMSLNFSPLQFIKEFRYHLVFFFTSIDKRELKSFYEAFFISTYQNSIWHPPKHLL